MLWLPLKSKKKSDDNWVEFQCKQPNFKIQNQIKETASKKIQTSLKIRKRKAALNLNNV